MPHFLSSCSCHWAIWALLSSEFLHPPTLTSGAPPLSSDLDVNLFLSPLLSLALLLARACLSPDDLDLELLWCFLVFLWCLSPPLLSTEDLDLDLWCWCLLMSLFLSSLPPLSPPPPPLALGVLDLDPDLEPDLLFTPDSCYNLFLLKLTISLRYLI
jgi:hypothetical protein